MKKLFFFAVVTAAVAMFGVRTGIVHAQTVTTNTENTAALQQELDVAKATLINLELQAGMIPAGDSQLGTGAAATATPSGTQGATGISASQAAYFNGVLSQLGSALVTLRDTLQANPNMNATQISAIASTLGSMQGTVSAISGEISQAGQGSQVAVTTPAANTGSAAAATGNGATNTHTATGVAQAAPATTSPSTGTATATAANPVQTTAQASSIWSFTASNWPVLAIILLVLAILAILFWPEKEAKAPTVQQSAAPSPKAPPAPTSGNAAADTQAKPIAPATAAPNASQGSTKVA